MSRSTELARGPVGILLALLVAALAFAACSTLEMPTPVHPARTDNLIAPTFEHRPPPLDAGTPAAPGAALDTPAGSQGAPDAASRESPAPHADAGQPATALESAR